MPFPGAGFTFDWGQFRLAEIQEFLIDEGSAEDTPMARSGNSSELDGRTVRLAAFQPCFKSDPPAFVFHPHKGVIGSLAISFVGRNRVDDPRNPPRDFQFGNRIWIVRHLARYEGFSCSVTANDVARFSHRFTLIKPFYGIKAVPRKGF